MIAYLSLKIILAKIFSIPSKSTLPIPILLTKATSTHSLAKDNLLQISNPNNLQLKYPMSHSLLVTTIIDNFTQKTKFVKPSK